MNGIHLRTLRLDDAQMVFEWRNDITIINLSSSQKKVTWEEHQRWIANSIDNPERKVYIICKDDAALGQVRFDRLDEPHLAAISVYLLGEHTGKGYGISAIQEGTQSIFSAWHDLKEVYAFVRTDNIPSQKAFIKSGYVQTQASMAPQNHLSYVISKTHE